MFINEGSRQPKGDDDKKKTWYILVVLADEFRVYKNRLDRTGVEFKLEDGATVTSACFDYNNSVLFLGMSTGYMRFIDLAACLEVDTEEEYQTIQPELRDAFNVAEHATGIADKNRPLPVTYLQRFEDTEDFETRSVLLLTLADEKCYILSYINPNNDPLLVEVKIDDCGDEEQKGHEKARDIDFGRMQIVRAQCAVNSLRFCLGLVDREVMAQDVSAGEVQKEFSRKNDRRSAMGLFQIDRKTLETKIDKWIVEVSPVFCVLSDVVPLPQILLRRQPDDGDVPVAQREGAGLPLPSVGFQDGVGRAGHALDGRGVPGADDDRRRPCARRRRQVRGGGLGDGAGPRGARQSGISKQ